MSDSSCSHLLVHGFFRRWLPTGGSDLWNASFYKGFSTKSVRLRLVAHEVTSHYRRNVISSPSDCQFVAYEPRVCSLRTKPFLP